MRCLRDQRRYRRIRRRQILGDIRRPGRGQVVVDRRSLEVAVCRGACRPLRLGDLLRPPAAQLQLRAVEVARDPRIGRGAHLLIVRLGPVGVEVRRPDGQSIVVSSGSRRWGPGSPPGRRGDLDMLSLERLPRPPAVLSWSCSSQRCCCGPPSHV